MSTAPRHAKTDAAWRLCERWLSYRPPSSSRTDLPAMMAMLRDVSELRSAIRQAVHARGKHRSTAALSRVIAEALHASPGDDRKTRAKQASAVLDLLMTLFATDDEKLSRRERRAIMDAALASINAIAEPPTPASLGVPLKPAHRSRRFVVLRGFLREWAQKHGASSSWQEDVFRDIVSPDGSLVYAPAPPESDNPPGIVVYGRRLRLRASRDRRFSDALFVFGIDDLKTPPSRTLTAAADWVLAREENPSGAGDIAAEIPWLATRSLAREDI